MPTPSTGMKRKQQEEHAAYQQMAKAMRPKPPLLRNIAAAFFVGGAICTLGQGIQNAYIQFFDFTPKTAGDPTVATLVFLSALLTGLGIYDKLGQFAGAGAGVPVTGFANSITSAAMEHRSEGLVLGVGGNMFKLAGSVIVFGVVAAFFIGLVRTILS